MVKLEDYTLTQLRKTISGYNKVIKFSGYSKLKKDELIKRIRSHPQLKVSEGVKGISIKVLEEFKKDIEKKVKKEKKIVSNTPKKKVVKKVEKIEKKITPKKEKVEEKKKVKNEKPKKETPPEVDYLATMKEALEDKSVVYDFLNSKYVLRRIINEKKGEDRLTSLKIFYEKLQQLAPLNVMPVYKGITKPKKEAPKPKKEAPKPKKEEPKLNTSGLEKFTQDGMMSIMGVNKYEGFLKGLDSKGLKFKTIHILPIIRAFLPHDFTRELIDKIGVGNMLKSLAVFVRTLTDKPIFYPTDEKELEGKGLPIRKLLNPILDFLRANKGKGKEFLNKINEN